MLDLLITTAGYYMNAFTAVLTGPDAILPVHLRAADGTDTVLATLVVGVGELVWILLRILTGVPLLVVYHTRSEQGQDGSLASGGYKELNDEDLNDAVRSSATRRFASSRR